MIKKCLSLKQPYAELLVSGKKTIELRTWNTKFRGEFLVHSSNKINKKTCERNKIDANSVTTGAIIGKAFLYELKYYKNRSLFLHDRNEHLAGTEYTDHKYGLLVKNSRKFRKPLFMLGRLGFF